MDFGRCCGRTSESRADVTIGGMPVHAAGGPQPGHHADGRRRRACVGFLEKPKTDQEVDIGAHGSELDRSAAACPSHGRDCLASMGIYLFNRDTLVDVLTKTGLPRLRQGGVPRLDSHPACSGASVRRLLGGHRHDPLVLRGESCPDGRQSAVRSVAARSAHLLAGPLSAAVADRRSHRSATASSPTAASSSGASRSRTASSGCGAIIGKDVTIRNSVIMGADDYETNGEVRESRSRGLTPLGVGEGSVVAGSIVDKNCRIGRGVRIEPSAHAAGCGHWGPMHGARWGPRRHQGRDAPGRLAALLVSWPSRRSLPRRLSCRRTWRRRCAPRQCPPCR